MYFILTWTWSGPILQGYFKNVLLKLSGEKGNKGEHGEPGIGERGEPGPVGPIGNHHSFAYCL